MRPLLPIIAALSPLLVGALVLILPAHAPAEQPVVPTPPDDPVVDGFDFPVGPADGAGYILTQAFQENAHLGEDWNGPGGGNSDLGDPVYAIARGRVALAEDTGDNGWGKVVRVVHTLPDGSEVESLYAHLDQVAVTEGEWIERRDPVGTIGTAHGAWSAHLHLELRSMARLPLGAGYGEPAGLYLDPSGFIAQRRPGRRPPERW